MNIFGVIGRGDSGLTNPCPVVENVPKAITCLGTSDSLREVPKNGLPKMTNRRVQRQADDGQLI